MAWCAFFFTSCFFFFDLDEIQDSEEYGWIGAKGEGRKGDKGAKLSVKYLGT